MVIHLIRLVFSPILSSVSSCPPH